MANEKKCPLCDHTARQDVILRHCRQRHPGRRLTAAQCEQFNCDHCSICGEVWSCHGGWLKKHELQCGQEQQPSPPSRGRSRERAPAHALRSPAPEPNNSHPKRVAVTAARQGEVGTTPADLRPDPAGPPQGNVRGRGTSGQSWHPPAAEPATRRPRQPAEPPDIFG